LHGGCLGFLTTPLNRHLGVCMPPPVASLRRRRPAHPLVPVSVKCWLALRWHACISFAAPMDGASSRQHRSAASGGGRRTHQRGGVSKRSGVQMGRHQKSAQKNWNLTPINSMRFGGDLQRHQDAGDHVVGGDGGGQLQHFGGGEMAGQLFEQCLIDLHIDGHLSGVLQHQTL